MPGPDNTLTLVIPGLLGPFPDGYSGMELPELSSLQTLLSRANRIPTPSPALEYERLLFSLFGYDYSPSDELPVASLRRLADGLEVDEHCYLCSDPVQLVADQDQVYLTASDELSVSVEEATMLAESFNRLYADEGWTLDFSHPQRCYLALDSEPELHTCSPIQAMGYAIKPWLPQGRDALQWHAIMNEIQMLFHASEINLERESRGQRLISGLWLWGSGYLPDVVAARYDKVWSDESLAIGLARHNSVDSEVSAPTLQRVLPMNRGLVILDRVRYAVTRDNLQLWEEKVMAMERVWFAPLVNKLKSGGLHALEIYPDNGYCYRITDRQLRRWWRRRKSMEHFING